MFAFVIIIILVIFLAFILGSVAYLISVIMDDSDDDPSQSTLGLDTDDFSRTPLQSPAEVFDGSLATNLDELRNTGTSCNCLKALEATQRIAKSIVASQSGKAIARPEIGAAIEADPQLLQGAALLASAAAVVARPEELQSAEMNSRLLKASETQREPAEVNGRGSAGNQAKADDQGQESAGISSWHSSAAAQKSIISSQLGSAVSKMIFDDFDTKEMQLGGTGLHWCKTRKSLDRLLKLGMPIDIVNKRQETAVHVAIRRHKLQVLIGLLNQGADIESRNESGETPLILACRVNDIFAVQMLLIYDADFDALDNANQTPRHHSASICDRHKEQKQLPSAAHLILAMLNEIGAKRCPPDSSHKPSDTSSSPEIRESRSACTDGCSHSGTYNGNSYNRWPNFARESPYKRCLFADLIESIRADLFKEGKRRSSGSRMICMDGGGLRGVIACQIMIELDKYLKKPVLSYFDWVGGTSVGAFIASALCMGISLPEMRRVCFEFKDEVFSGIRPYNSKFLERVLKRTLGSKSRMSDVRGVKLTFATVLADREPCQLKMFRNYRSETELLEAYDFSADHYNNMSGHTTVATTGRRNTLTRVSKQSAKKGAQTKDSSQRTVKASAGSKENSNTSADKKAETSSDQSKDEATSSGSAGASKDPEEGSKKGSKNTKAEPAQLTKESDPVLDENDRDPIVWQAVRASAAAPFFFKPYGPYLDGGIISNNPTLDLLTEFTNYHKVRQFIRRRSHARPKAELERDLGTESNGKLDVVISLGTGRGRVIGRQAMVDFGQIATGISAVFSPVELVRSIRAARDLFKRLMQQSCHTDDHILDRAQAWCADMGVPYFRLNPPLATIFSIDDKRDEQLINALWQTKLYMLSMKEHLIELAELLDGVPFTSQIPEQTQLKRRKRNSLLVPESK